jgi:hypothetical protein
MEVGNMADIINLPSDFIGKEDEQRLESFASHLIAHGRATRWHWNRKSGIDVAFEVFRGGADEELLVTIKRDRKEDAFHARDGNGRDLAHGTLDHVMAVIDRAAALSRPEGPA